MSVFTGLVQSSGDCLNCTLIHNIFSFLGGIRFNVMGTINLKIAVKYIKNEEAQLYGRI